MEVPAIPTSGFFRHELDRALRENGYALMAWELLQSVDDDRGGAAHAEASVELLPENESQGDRGRTVEIQLTLQGYQVRIKRELSDVLCCQSSLSQANESKLTCLFPLQIKQPISEERTQHYETLDDLLSAISPAYSRRRQRLLFAKLEDVAKERSWDEQKDEKDEEEEAKA